MTDQRLRSAQPGSELGDTSGGAASDARRPYEAPRVVIKRSVASATLLHVTGPHGSMLFTMG
jgi:hypothetical protein